MRNIIYKYFLVCFLYFMVLLGIALFVRDIPNQPDSFSTSLQQIIKTSEMRDPASFATAALDVAENGWVKSSNHWILNLWPPGFVLLEAVIIKIFGFFVPVILVLQILAAALYACALTLLYGIFRENLRDKVAFLLPLIVFMFPVARIFLLQPTGIMFGESFAIGFFFIGVLSSFNSIIKKSLLYAGSAGLCLAMSAYFRSQFEIIILILSLYGVLFVAAIRWTSLFKFVHLQSEISTRKSIIVIVVVTHAAMIPWRVYHLVNHEGPQWVQTSSVTFRNSVMTAESLENINGKFVVLGGGNLVCRIDPATCDDTINAKYHFIKTFIKHPVEWYSFKADIVGKYWFSSIKNWMDIKFNATLMDVVINGIILLLLPVVIVIQLSRALRFHDCWILLLWFNSAILSAYFLIFTVQQFETRYFYFPKIFIVFMVVLILYLKVKHPLNGSKLYF